MAPPTLYQADKARLGLPSNSRHETWSVALAREFSRRAAVGLGVFAAGAAVTGCGGNERSTPNEKGKAWSYTDARGKRVSVDHRPKRIVAYSGLIGALHDYDLHFVGVYGPHAPVHGKPNPQSGDADFSKLKSVGEQYGDFSIEKLFALHPDLILETSFVPKQPFYLPKQALPKVEKVVPVALVDQSPRVRTEDLLRKMEQLARSLGGNPDAQAAKEGRKRFRDASSAIEKRARAKNLRVIMVSGSPDQVYVTHPEGQANAKYLQDLGVKFTDPPHRKKNEEFVGLSWEEIERYPADVVLYDSRPQAMSRQQLMGHPTFKALPAIQAGQLEPWNPEIPPSYLQLAKNLEPVADWLRRFHRVDA